MNNITFSQVSLGAAYNASPENKVRFLRTVGEEVTQLILDNRLVAPLLHTIALEEVPSTLKAMLNANTTGKIVLKL